ncbi:MAG TPA: hypothetical protein PK512_04145, partial [bacterium]|nr:hypothetical protein [bacterium]
IRLRARKNTIINTMAPAISLEILNLLLISAVKNLVQRFPIYIPAKIPIRKKEERRKPFLIPHNNPRSIKITLTISMLILLPLT